MQTPEKKWIVGIVEDEARFRNDFTERLLLEPDIAKVQAFASAELFLSEADPATLDVVLVDHLLPHMSGVELIRKLYNQYPTLPGIVVSSVLSDDVIFEAIRAGAVGYVLKSDVDNLGDVIRQVMDGGAVISPTIAVRVLNNFRRPPTTEDPGLTDREEQVLRELVTGSQPEDVADLLGITVGTLRNHIKKIYKKLHVRNRIELMRRAESLGYR